MAKHNERKNGSRPPPTRVEIEIPADFEGIVKVSIRVRRNGSVVVESRENLPSNSADPEGS